MATALGPNDSFKAIGVRGRAMIYKRVAAWLRGQDWVAILIELGIVILGVFVGTQVSNWNATRTERL